MTVTQGHPLPTRGHADTHTTPDPAVPPQQGRIALTALRIGMGVVFLWAFLDKTFGLGYATGTAKAWIHGGSPTKGFLGAVDVGPLQTPFHTMAGAWWADWLFMLGLAGVGVAVLVGVARRPTPIVDYHVIYALALIVLAATNAGRFWGLGAWWARLPIVRDHAWAR